MLRPFFVFGLPRSRTFWISRFLTYGGWNCSHEEICNIRSLEDVRAWLSLPLVGTAETAAAPWWRILHKLCPDARIVIIRRDPGQSFESMMRLGISFDPVLLAREIRKLDAKLGQITARWPGALSVAYDDLRQEETCARIFEHCLGLPYDPAWWQTLHGMNLQIDMPALMRRFIAFQPQLTKLAAMLKQQSIRDMRLRPIVAPEGITIQAESFEDFYCGAQHLFRDHLVAVGEAPDSAAGKNIPVFRKMDKMGNLQVMTARCNGRMFGYLMTLTSPSLEDANRITAVHTTFYAAPEFPGLGMKLQRAALARLREIGVDEVYFRAGPRGNGPKMGALYRRLGAVSDGDLYRLQGLQEA